MITVDELTATSPVVSSADPSITFDDYASEYEESLQYGLTVSGEKPEYFARRRIQWTRSLLDSKGVQISTVLDFGCGVGIATPLLNEILCPNCIWGFDPSRAAIERARRDHTCSTNNFVDSANVLPTSICDLVYTNGVFHHIPPDERATALATVWRTLRPGGWFAFWENNPWNPGTRLVMSRIPFDRDAIVISPFEANHLLLSAGFTTVRTDAWFLFPHALRWLRGFESLFHRFPLGAQYLVLAQKPLINERQ
ncbi:class I SAM-dependent methyltransferase [Bythopirellula polymerisocia]|uniref:Putative methyltransferase n=1 Tax=Bythopirellula polymerisocia TaxID=2528003 RepID=A0A5C6D0X9_9BACT|nr:class I SAM-dependent methyltransferase [Bythopirellula polymerisocia]TWU29401.1 putative methyltransferase [Bythopirellula polymerisocia]